MNKIEKKGILFPAIHEIMAAAPVSGPLSGDSDPDPDHTDVINLFDVSPP